MTESNHKSEQQVRLRLSTRDAGITIDEAPILVPTSFRRYTLSTLVNGLLETEKPIPLDFLINGTYLRTTIEEYLSESGLSPETTLTVEYVRARVPPQYIASFQHDDWVSSVDVLLSSASIDKQARILSSSYDGHLRVWNTSSQVIATTPNTGDAGHAAFVTDARFVSADRLVSCSFDRTIRLWKYSEEDASRGTIAPQLQLYGHKDSVESIRVHAKSSRLISASTDHSVGFWSTRKADAPAASEDLVPRTINKDGKRRKLNPAVSVPQRGPLALLQEHTAPVSGAMFDTKDATVGYSASWDHTVRTWDLVTAALVDTRTTGHALFAVEQMPEVHLVAVGSAGRDVKLVDVRESATNVVAMTLKGHRNHVVALASDPSSAYTLASGSHDGTCRVWDVRSTRQSKEGVTGQSLYTISRESQKGAGQQQDTQKVFGIHWDREVGILSAGEDRTVQINRGQDIT